jgi:hypothetical protein
LLFTVEEIHAIGNLRGIPADVNASLHLSQMRREWNNFYSDNPSPSKQQVIDKTAEIDKKYGADFKPPMGQQ